MEYTRSKGDEYETFEGTPEEIAKLINVIERTESNAETVHEPKPVTEEKTSTTGFPFHKVVDYECSCGDKGCELYKTERG